MVDTDHPPGEKDRVALTTTAASSATGAAEGAAPAGRVLLLDGGTGEELFRRGVPDDRAIWSARALVDARHHEAVREVHASFIAAGSRYITTSNYAVTPGAGLESRLEELVALAGRLAVEARDRAEERGRPVQICGSLPPLVESYRPDLVLPHDRGAALYERIARALGPSADVFLAETMSSVAESLSAVHGARRADPEKEVWVSWTLRADGRLRSGEPAADAARALLDEGVSALLFNCCEPEAALIALRELAAAPGVLAPARDRGVRTGVYANRLTPVPEGFAMAETTAPQAMREDMPPAEYEQIAARWAELGAELIGGCCGIGPEYIQRLRGRFG